jgi:hypothetical protein
MPFYLQHMREQHTQLASLKAQLDSLTSKTAAKEQSDAGALACRLLGCGGSSKPAQMPRSLVRGWADAS